jgi:hypothetical protein
MALLLRTYLEYFRHRRSLSGMPVSVEDHEVPTVQGMVGTFRLVRREVSFHAGVCNAFGFSR